MTIRCFIAVDIEDELKKQLEKVQEKIMVCGADIKYVERENIHLTLKFLGEVEERRIEPIKRALLEVADKYTPFEIELGGIGVFPSPSYLRVIWVGITRGQDKLGEIHTKIEENLYQLGFKRENRGFSCHITVGRVRSPRNKGKLVEVLSRLRDIQIGTQTVDSIELKQSQLSPKGPIYTTLKSVKLKPFSKV